MPPKLIPTADEKSESACVPLALVQPSLPPPPLFHPGDDFPLWACRMKVYLSTVHPDQHGQFIISRLDDAATRRVLHSGVPLSEPPDTLWRYLADLFDATPPAGVFMERFFDRRQQPGEDVDGYADSLRELVSHAFPDVSQQVRDTHVVQRFMAGVLNDDLRGKFRRKSDLSLSDALRIARTYQDLSERKPPVSGSNPTWQPAAGPPANRRPAHIPPNSTPVSNDTRFCYYCARFGGNARRCGHNSHGPFSMERQ